LGDGNAARANVFVKTTGYVAARGLPQHASEQAIAENIIRRSGVGSGFKATVVPYTARRQHLARVLMTDTTPTDQYGVPGQREQWVEGVIIGAIAEAFIDRGLPPVGWAQTGSGKDVTGGPLDTIAGQRFSHATNPSIIRKVRSVLNGADVTLVSVQVIRAGQPAPAVIVKTSQPVRALKQAAGVIDRLFGVGRTPVYEGHFYEIEDATGQPVLAVSASYRDGVGGQWVSPRYPADYPFPHG
jgi:hypothetical protein